MTREDAIKTLRELWRETNNSWYEEVYDMAIEALSAGVVHKPDYSYEADMVRRLKEALSDETRDKRTETHGVCSDLIRRQDVYHILEKEMIDRPLDSDRWIIRDIDKAIRSLPSADRPTGGWIDAEIPLSSGGSMPIQACNLCKTFYPLAYTGGGHRFCPNCGAKMGGNNHD